MDIFTPEIPKDNQDNPVIKRKGGAPRGNTYARKPHKQKFIEIWEKATTKKEFILVRDTIVKCALDGESWACKEYIERSMGKVTTPVDINEAKPMFDIQQKLSQKLKVINATDPNITGISNPT